MCFRGESRINNDRFPNSEKASRGAKGMLPRECFGFELSKVPFPVFLTDFRKTVEPVWIHPCVCCRLIRTDLPAFTSWSACAEFNRYLIA